MTSKGSFGYKIGRKIKLMSVECDAELLWQICVREIYVLMKHFKTIDSLKHSFENLKEVKGKTIPKASSLEKCKEYMDLTIYSNNISNQNNQSIKNNIEWSNLARFCQHSFINMIESGYILNNGDDTTGLTLIIDFNTNSVIFYSKEKDKHKKIREHDKATIDEIMEFDDMPTKSYGDIVNESRERFKKFSTNIEKVLDEINRIEGIIQKAKDLGGDQNIIIKANKLLDDMKWEKKRIELDYRYFYHRLDALNMIDHNT